MRQAYREATREEILAERNQLKERLETYIKELEIELEEWKIRYFGDQSHQGWVEVDNFFKWAVKNDWNYTNDTWVHEYRTYAGFRIFRTTQQMWEEFINLDVFTR